MTESTRKRGRPPGDPAELLFTLSVIRNEVEPLWLETFQIEIQQTVDMIDRFRSLFQRRPPRAGEVYSVSKFCILDEYQLSVVQLWLRNKFPELQSRFESFELLSRPKILHYVFFSALDAPFHYGKRPDKNTAPCESFSEWKELQPNLAGFT